MRELNSQLTAFDDDSAVFGQSGPACLE